MRGGIQHAKDVGSRRRGRQWSVTPDEIYFHRTFATHGASTPFFNLRNYFINATAGTRVEDGQGHNEPRIRNAVR